MKIQKITKLASCDPLPHPHNPVPTDFKTENSKSSSTQTGGLRAQISATEFRGQHYPTKGSITQLKGSICLSASEPNKTQTGACSKESKGLCLGTGSCLETGEPTLKDLAPHGFRGGGLDGRKSLIMVTKGVGVLVRAMVSTDWPSLG